MNLTARAIAEENTKMKTTKNLTTLPVTYTTGCGGPHGDPGHYRINPVTGERTFSPWLGSGTFVARKDQRERTVREVVCAACGADQEPDPWGNRPYCNCEPR